MDEYKHHPRIINIHPNPHPRFHVSAEAWDGEAPSFREAARAGSNSNGGDGEVAATGNCGMAASGGEGENRGPNLQTRRNSAALGHVKIAISHCQIPASSSRHRIPPLPHGVPEHFACDFYPWDVASGSPLCHVSP